MSAWSRCGQPSCWQMPFFHSIDAGYVGPARSVRPVRASPPAQTSMNGCPTISTCLPTGEARHRLRDPALLRTARRGGRRGRRPCAPGRDRSRAAARPGRRRPRGTPRPRPRSAGRRPRPSRRARRRAVPRRRSGSPGRPGPWRRGRRPTRRPSDVGLAGAAAVTGASEDHRLAFEQEAGAEREGTPLPAPVLEGHRVQVAVDGDDLAAPVGGDLLDDQAGSGLGLDGAAALGRRASRQPGHRCRSGRGRHASTLGADRLVCARNTSTRLVHERVTTWHWSALDRGTVAIYRQPIAKQLVQATHRDRRVRTDPEDDLVEGHRHERGESGRWDTAGARLGAGLDGARLERTGPGGTAPTGPPPWVQELVAQLRRSGLGRDSRRRPRVRRGDVRYGDPRRARAGADERLPDHPADLRAHQRRLEAQPRLGLPDRPAARGRRAWSRAARPTDDGCWR